MKKFVATALVAAAAAVFAVPGAAQIPANAMALVASAPQAIPFEASRLMPTMINAGPEPGTAWVFALGFLALVVLRRLGSRDF